jgi:GNAT superfamily N-acetyltransferase
VIRPARTDDAERLREVERAAGLQFGDVGMPDIAAAEPMAASELIRVGNVVGYVVVEVVDGCAHIEQLSVVPDHQGRGIGRALVEAVSTWARDQGLPAITLTTFTDVPWNRPLYEHLGFHVLAEAEITGGLRTLRESEAAHGLDPSIRVCMRRDL